MNSTRKQIVRPQKIGHYGADMFSTVVAIVRNRTGADFHAAWNAVNRDNAELFEQKETFYGGCNFHKLLNRSARATGRPAIWVTEKASSEIQALTNRIAPFMAREPVATQWECLYRAALAVGTQAQVRNRLLNRAPGEVAESDWKAANAGAQNVLNLLENEPDAVDRGPMLANASLTLVRGVFRRAMARLMREQGLDQRAAFEKLKEDEPLFWTMAVLAIDDIGLNGADPNATEITRGGIRVFSQEKFDELSAQKF